MSAFMAGGEVQNKKQHTKDELIPDSLLAEKLKIMGKNVFMQ